MFFSLHHSKHFFRLPLLPVSNFLNFLAFYFYYLGCGCTSQPTRGLLTIARQVGHLQNITYYYNLILFHQSFVIFSIMTVFFHGQSYVVTWNNLNQNKWRYILSHTYHIYQAFFFHSILSNALKRKTLLKYISCYIVSIINSTCSSKTKGYNR